MARRLASILSQGRRFYSAPSFSQQLTYQNSLITGPETKITTLPNGLRVATEKTPHKTATVGLYINAGSRFEDDRTNGTAHFLEHMAFKGTKRRSQSDLEIEVENQGSLLNAYTSREQTVYYAKCFSKNIPGTVDILSDILQNSLMASTQVEIERDVIKREMKEIENQPEEVVFDHLHAIAFQNNPLGKTILGPIQNVESITRDDLLSFIKTHYTAPRIVLAAAGGVDHDQLVKLAEQHFGGLPAGNNSPTPTPVSFTGAQISYRDDFLPYAHVALAVEGVGLSHPDYFPLLVANAVVGCWDKSVGGAKNLSSRLARNVATHGLAHNFMSFHTSYADTGLWGIYGVCDAEQVDDFTYAATQEWMHLCTTVSDAEVERAKNQIKAALLFQVDGTTPLCDEIGRQLLSFGRRIHPSELDARINVINASTVRDVATRYIYDKCPAVAAIGPVEQLPDYNRLRGNMSWARI